jgi:hypothetical protein
MNNRQVNRYELSRCTRTLGLGPRGGIGPASAAATCSQHAAQAIEDPGAANVVQEGHPGGASPELLYDAIRIDFEDINPTTRGIGHHGPGLAGAHPLPDGPTHTAAVAAEVRTPPRPSNRAPSAVIAWGGRGECREHEPGEAFPCDRAVDVLRPDEDCCRRSQSSWPPTALRRGNHGVAGALTGWDFRLRIRP